MTTLSTTAFIAPALLLTSVLAFAQNGGLSPTLDVERDADSLILTVSDDQEFFAGILAAPTSELLPGVGILQNAFIAASGPSVRGTYQLKVTAPNAFDVFYVQAVTIAEGPVWGLSAVVRVSPNVSDEPGDGSDDPPEDGLGELDRVECDLLIAESFPLQYYLQANFVAHSDGYDLLGAGVEQNGAMADVYVVLKKPGKGEGMLDVVERHELLVPLGTLPTVQIVRVFIGEGVGRLDDGEDLRKGREFHLKEQYRIRL